MTDENFFLPQDGFLSPDLMVSIDRIRKEYAPWFNCAAAFSNLGMNVLRAVKPGTSNNQQLVVALLYGRVLTSFQTSYILTERGLVADARTVIRGAAETTIVLCALTADVTIADKLVTRHLWHRRKILSSWLADPQAVTEMTIEQQSLFRKELAALDAANPQLKKMKDPLIIADLARPTGLLFMYNAVYRMTSGDAAHTTLDALDRHVRADERSNIYGLKFGPDTKDVADTISEAISVLGAAINSVVVFFSLNEFKALLDAHTATRKALGIPSDHKPVS